MKTGLGLHRKLRILYAYYNLFLFWFRKVLIGFDVANQYIQRIDKTSVQLILKNNGANIGQNCDLGTGLTFHNCKDYSNLTIGNNCHIGKNCFFDLREKVIIKSNVVISMGCTFITHIDMTKSALSKIFVANKKQIVIENDVYIGANCTILKGTVIQKKAFIGALSLVNKNVLSNTMVVGIPAIKIREGLLN